MRLKKWIGNKLFIKKKYLYYNIKMCDICNNETPRTYTHSRNSYHKKNLYKIMLLRKRTGYYLSNNNIPNNVSLSKN